MYDKISTINMSSEEWLRMRKTGIGGSDAGAVCGVNPYCSAMSVFQDKTGTELAKADSEAVRIGRDLEQYVAKRFTEASGLKVRRSNYMYRSKEHPFMIADIDRLISGEDAGLECKTVSAFHAGKWADGNIPLHYVMQCYHYMAVTKKRAWYIAAVILGKEFIYRKLEWDDELIQQMTEIEEKFWNSCVIPKVMPSPDGSRASDEVIQRYFRTAKKASAIELVGFDEKLERRDKILRHIASLEEEQKQIEQEVKIFMGENEYAWNDRWHVSWGNVDSMRLDAKRIKSEKPEIYESYAKASHSRRFEIKAA